MNFNRRTLLPIFRILTALLAGSHIVTAETAPVPRYNVLLIMADDLRPAMNCYGDAQAKTPHLDRLAARGVRFERAYVQYPVCNPSRVSMLTGTRPEHNGVTGNALFFREKMPDIVTLPQLFRQHGAAAHSYGKIYHAGLVEGETENRFLDTGKSWDEARMFRPTELGNTGPRRSLTQGKLKWCEVADLEGGDNDQSDGQTAQQTIAAMERLADKRWFIGAGFHRPHDPFVVGKRYVAQYPAGSLTLHRDPSDASPLLKQSLGGGAFETAFKEFDDRDRMDFLTHYYAGVTQTDAQVGRLMEAMDRLKLWDKTVVIFVGDHGYHLGERGWWNKNTLFDRSCRAPFLLIAPGVKPGVCRSLVEFLDIYPTIAGLCGLAAPATVQGRSLQPLLADPAGTLHESVLTHIVRGGGITGYGLRTARWRLVAWSDGSAELYDHDNDPGEWHNLASDAAHAGTLAELKRQLADKTKAPANPGNTKAQARYDARDISGWSVHISRKLIASDAQATEHALTLLKKMLDEIVRDVPAAAVAELKKVPLYFNPSYKGGRSGAEFHPGAGWLRDNGRDPDMARAVEFSGVHDFEAEMRRMPNFALHELAHAYHNRVLKDGFDAAEIKTAYVHAKIAGRYERVERSRGDGSPNTFERAYAITDPMEYFAEATEAYFSRNDFFPFTRDELKSHDPEMFALLEKLWGVTPAK